MEAHALKDWLKEFRRDWPAMLGGEELALWRDVELNALS